MTRMLVMCVMLIVHAVIDHAVVVGLNQGCVAIVAGLAPLFQRDWLSLRMC